MGWYAMALVDTLDYFPENNPQRAELLQILKRLAVAVQHYQDSNSGLWYQVLDKAGEKGNYLEASAACMFTYALAKGVRKGYLPASYFDVAQRGYRGIVSRFIKSDSSGQVNLEGTVSVAGLGGNPYRDGSYEYYLSEKVVTNDPKGVGAFLMATNEMEIAAEKKVGNGKTVTLDSFFNNEWKKDATGKRFAGTTNGKRWTTVVSTSGGMPSTGLARRLKLCTRPRLSLICAALTSTSLWIPIRRRKLITLTSSKHRTQR